MAQGAVKKSGKRSQAVSAKRRPSWPPRWRHFRNLVFTVRGWSRWLNAPGIENQSALLLPFERGAVCGSPAADPRHLAGAAEGLS